MPFGNLFMERPSYMRLVKAPLFDWSCDA